MASLPRTLQERLDDLERQYRELLAEIEEQFGEFERRSSNVLDRIQGELPEEAQSVMRRTRDLSATMRRRLETLADQALEATKDAVESLAETGAQLTGLSGRDEDAAPAPAEKTAAAKPAAKKPAAKKKAPAKKPATKKKAPAKKAAAGKATTGKPSASWTKAQLLDEAKRRKVSGRTTMTKAQLVKALAD